MRGLRDPRSAARLYRPFRAGFAVERGPLLGFREYPEGIERRPDVDFGPIVLGVGASATGLGLAAARVSGAPADVASLTRLAQCSRWMAAGLSPGQRAAARAILLFAGTARSWTG